MRNKSYLIIAIVIVICIAIFFVYNFSTRKVANVADLATDQKLESSVLLNDFESDEKAANLRYLDKTLEVSGKVNKKEVRDGITSLYLNTENELSAVICQMAEPVEISEGAEVVVKGVCSGYLMDVILVRCILL